MKKAILVFALLALASGTALAHGGGRLHFGLHFAFPLYPYSYYYYPPPAYYPPYPVTVVRPSPPVYVERDEPDAAESWWYYCEGSRGYYPYVKSCPGGWQRVPPAPPPAR